jgi:formylglycine-generating enzyme required for sulfatase activity
VGAQASSVNQVFISHAEEDADFAHRLAEDLKRLGVQVWIAPESILPGESWVDAIERGLSESSHVVIVLTPAALQAPGVKMERDIAITLALQDRIKVISLRVKPCEVPLVLSRYQMILAFQEDYEAGFRQLARVLGLSVTPAESALPPRRAPQSVPVPEAASPTVVEQRQPFEPELIHVPAGEFLMGSDPNKDKEARSDEQPQHRLHLPDYAIAKTPVTNAHYLAFVQDTGRSKPEHWKRGKPRKGKEDHPVVNVSWDDAVAYCNWLAETTGKGYRLPTEAEWEKAGRGADGRIFPWGNDPPDEERCNFGKYVGGTTPVGQYSPKGDSPYGCVDMAGNVWEWTLGVYKEYPYDPKDGREIPEASGPRVLRGGASGSDEGDVRCAPRNWFSPDLRNGYVGFRVVLAPGFASGL